MNTLIILNTIIFIGIALIHVYWAFGVIWAGQAVIPTKSDGNLMFKPGFVPTTMVAFGFVFFALVMLSNLNNTFIKLPKPLRYYTTLAIAIVFLLRAIGEFKYVGFTKRVRQTQFAKYDTKFYSPLCLLISVNTFVIDYLNTL